MNASIASSLRLRKRLFYPLLGIALSITSLTTFANTITLQQGLTIPELGGTPYTGVENLTLIGGTFSTRNYGNSNSLWAGQGTSSEPRRILLRFDLTGLDSIDTPIESVKLTMTQIRQSGSNTGTVGLNVHAVADANSGWVQGSASGSAQSGSSSWDYRAYNTQTWSGGNGLSTPGTDYLAPAIDGTKSITTGAGSSLDGRTYEWNLPVALIAAWISGQNAGLLFEVPDTDLVNGDYFRFASSSYEATSQTHAYRPALSITYQNIPEPGSFALFSAAGLIGAAFLRKRSA